MDDIKNFLNSAEHRKSLFDMGIEYGKKFIEKHKLLNKKDETIVNETKDETIVNGKTIVNDKTDEIEQTKKAEIASDKL